MSTPTVTTSHVDGGLGLTQFDRWRIHAKIGVAEGGDIDTPKLMINERQARDYLLSGPLFDRGVEHFESFWTERGEPTQPFYAVRATADTLGSAAHTKTAGTGLAAAPTLGGTPTASREVLMRITTGGAHGAAEYRLSTDGGLTYAAPLVTPTSGTPINLALGATATFADDGTTPANTFQVGDIHRFTLTGPTASNASLITAC